MPQFKTEIILPRMVGEVFDFFCVPANRLLLAPPDWNMSLEDAPARLQLGSRLVLRTRRWGMPQQLAVEITAFEPNVCLVEEQREGPFRRWIHRHQFEVVPEGTRLHDWVEYDPPGGILGLLLTPRRIEEELKALFAYRQKMLQELLGPADS